MEIFERKAGLYIKKIKILITAIWDICLTRATRRLLLHLRAASKKKKSVNFYRNKIVHFFCSKYKIYRSNVKQTEKSNPSSFKKLS